MKSTDMKGQDELLRELGEIRDAYRVDVAQFIAFTKEWRLPLVQALEAYALWLDREHDGKRYSPATINRKIAAAKSRVRYAFKHSSSADSLRKKYRLEEVLKSVKPKRMDGIVVPTEKVPSIDEVRKLFRETKDGTIKLMVAFLVGTGVRISEMLSIRMSDLGPANRGFAEITVVGKGGKERQVHVKTAFVDRVRKHFRGTSYLFEHQGRPFSRISVTNRIKHEALKTIGREVTAQQLRHAWAVIQIRRGKDLSAVSAALGHSDPGSTVRARSGKTLRPREAFLDIEDPKQSGAKAAVDREQDDRTNGPD
ncbi:MAG: tyrosine-type recombinase/integrase [Rectinemataceae bacterium]